MCRLRPRRSGAPIIGTGRPFNPSEGRVRARRAAGLLHIVGAEEWIAPDENAYVAQAATWAQHPGDLAAARARLLSQVRRSPLCNASAVAGAIETAYRDAWRIACRKNSNPPPGAAP